MNVDVAIVGGGPAGCAAAMTLRSAGYSVAIIASPGRQNKPTETSVPALAGVLRSIGGAEALTCCEPCFGICSAWGRSDPALQPSILNPFGHAWFIHRDRFDKCLQGAVRRAGAVWIDGLAQEVALDASGVSVSIGGAALEARYLVAATGSPSWAGRITKQHPIKSDTLIALWARIPIALKERFLFIEPTNFGWWYLCPGDGPETIACLVTDPACAHSLEVKNATAWTNLFTRTTLSNRVQGYASPAIIYAAPTGLSELPNKAGTRWIAVGDAAAKLDPLGSAGAFAALDSGRRAAHVITASLEGDTAAADRYDRWISNLCREFVRQRKQQYALETTRHGEGFWTRRAETAHSPRPLLEEALASS